MKNLRHILLLEDDQSFGYILSEYLTMHDMKIVWVKSGEEALKQLPKYNFQLALLDIMLPGIDGYAFAEQLYRLHPHIPFIFISAKSLKVDQLKGYKLGAFDYITKPIDEELLVAKIKSLISKNIGDPKIHSAESYPIGNYIFKPNEQLLELNEQFFQLTTREAELLHMLVNYKNQLLERNLALRTIWGNTDEFSRKSMDVFISHLRRYLSEDISISIKNIHGKGFILKVP